jgi:hypothetical protein
MRRGRRFTNCENAVVHPILNIQFRSIRSQLCRRFLWRVMGLPEIVPNNKFSRAAKHPCADSVLGGNRAAAFYLALPVITDHPDTFRVAHLMKQCKACPQN